MEESKNNSRFLSRFEQNVKDALDDLKIKYELNAVTKRLSFYLGEGDPPHYTTDFVLHLLFNKKLVLLEPHGYNQFKGDDKAKTFLFKLFKFKGLKESDEFYLILITDTPKFAFDGMLKSFHYKNNQIYNKLWLEEDGLRKELRRSSLKGFKLKKKRRKIIANSEFFYQAPGIFYASAANKPFNSKTEIENQRRIYLRNQLSILKNGCRELSNLDFNDRMSKYQYETIK